MAPERPANAHQTPVVGGGFGASFAPLGGGGGSGSSNSNSNSNGGFVPQIPNILPHERVFPIQIGAELFKLSGASLSSDAPSYFSQYFLCQLDKAAENNNGDDNNNNPSSSSSMPAVRTLYIDRDPRTFRDIALHLQGYHVAPRDGTHFVRLFADAQFYALPRLVSQLYDESIFMSIGHREFQIPRDLFSAVGPGNTPNFFSLGFAIFFSHPPDNVFPGLNRQGLIRPPSILPPSVPGRSADTFAELLHLLRGYPVRVRDDAHRASLLRDCRYFNFKGLEQRLVPHALGFNQARGREEITLRIDDILKSGISVRPDDNDDGGDDDDVDGGDGGGDGGYGWVNYARPFVDDKPFELVLEIGGENTRLHFLGPPPPPPAPTTTTTTTPSSSSSSSPPVPSSSPITTTTTRVEFFRDARARVTKLLEVVAAKLALPPPAPAQPLGLLLLNGGGGGQHGAATTTNTNNNNPAAAAGPGPGHTPLSAGHDWVACVLGPEASITLDGRPFTGHHHHRDVAAAAAGGRERESSSATTQQQQQQHDVPFPSHQPQAAVPSPFYHHPTATTAITPNNSNVNNITGPNHHHPNPNDNDNDHHLLPPRKRRRTEGGENGFPPSSSPFPPPNNNSNNNNNNNPSPSPTPNYWILKTGQWRLRIRRTAGTGSGSGSSLECCLHAVKLDAMSGELARNAARGFLSG